MRRGLLRDTVGWNFLNGAAFELRARCLTATYAGRRFEVPAERTVCASSAGEPESIPVGIANGCCGA